MPLPLSRQQFCYSRGQKPQKPRLLWFEPQMKEPRRVKDFQIKISTFFILLTHLLASFVIIFTVKWFHGCVYSTVSSLTISFSFPLPACYCFFNKQLMSNQYAGYIRSIKEGVLKLSHILFVWSIPYVAKINVRSTATSALANYFFTGTNI